MALQTINIGNLANDGTGDDLRLAFIKVNSNFSVLNSILDATDTEGENIGTGEGIFAQKSDDVLQFKSLHQGDGITLSSSGNSITITAKPSIDELIIISDNGSLIVPPGNQIVRIQGGRNTLTHYDIDRFKIDVVGENLVKLDPAPKLGGNLQASGRNITGAGNVAANKFLGPLEGLVYGIDVRNLNTSLNEFDLGLILPTAKNVLEWLIFTTEFDFGTFANETYINVDGGLF